MSSAHPLDPAGAEEYLAGRDIMVAAGLLPDPGRAPVRFAYYGLEEAPKDEVLAGEAPDRRLRAYLVNTGTGESSDVVVSLTHQKVVSARTLDPAAHGQMPILDSDFARVDEDGPGTSVHPGGRARPGLGAPGRRTRRLRGPDRAEGLQGHGRVRAPGAGLPIGPDNPYGNAIVQQVTRLTRESQAGRRADGSRGRTWRIISTERSNRFGRPTSYTLYPEAAPVLLADPDSPLAARAGFAANHLWVTRYDPDQRWPAGDYVNQNPGGAGMPAFIAGDRDIDGEDIVVWHTFGPTHVPRPEDWPVMPVARCGFVLKPTGFFDRNPTLDVAPPAAHC